MRLKHTKKEVICVDHTDLEELVNMVYTGLYPPYNFRWEFGEERGRVRKFEVGMGVLNKREQEQLDEFRRGVKVANILVVLLNDLCNQGIIIPGTYLIGVNCFNESILWGIIKFASKG